MTIQTKETLYTSLEAALYLGLKNDTVRKHVQRGLLQVHDTIGKAYLFAKSELDRYKKERLPRGNPSLQRKSAKKRGR